MALEGDIKKLAAFIGGELLNPQTSWNVGAFGAIAEFHHQGAPSLEPIAPACGPAWLASITDGGAIGVHVDPNARPIAYEILSARAGLWLHGAAICLPEARARMGARTCVTALGIDTEAIRPIDRESALFDLGLGLESVDFCVRTSDPSLVAILVEHEGRPLLGSDRLVATLKEASPHRVARSRLARVEVFQPIGREGGVSPEGPHTHLLPDLLRVRRTHASTLPIPPGWLPCVSLYPASPVQDDHGRIRPFDSTAYQRFDAWLAEFGEPTYVAAKRALFEHVRAGRLPRDVPPATTRLTRNARRIAVRQLAHLDGPSPILTAWQSTIEPGEARPAVHAH
ncbi:MAG: DUF6925 family protein [Burkholderiales bacterium]